MEVKQVAALPKPFAVMDVEMSDEVLTITALSTQACPCCPLCGKPSARVHSRYLRQVADLPCGGRQVRLLVQVRTCFCEAPSCRRKIFVERLTPFARVTQRLCRNRAGYWARDRWQAGSPCYSSPEHPDQSDDHSSAHHGAAYRGGWDGFTDWD